MATKKTLIKLLDIVGDVTVINMDDVSYIATDLNNTVKIKFTRSDTIYRFSEIVQESIDKIYEI